MTNPFKARAQQRDAQRALIQALDKRDVPKVWEALRQGAALRGFDATGVPVLQRVMDLNEDDVVPLMRRALDDGAGLEDVPRVSNVGFAFTPLLKAAWNGSLEQINLLLERGALIKALSGKDHGTGLRQKKPRWDRSTVVHLACHLHDTEVAVLQRLLEEGARIDRYDGNGHQPLHTALISERRARSTVCEVTAVSVLLAAGADPNVPVRGARREATLVGDRPLHLAADHGRVADAQALLDAGADPDARDAQGLTPLLRAQRAPRPEQALIALLERHLLTGLETRPSLEGSLDTPRRRL